MQNIILFDSSFFIWCVLSTIYEIGLLTFWSTASQLQWKRFYSLMQMKTLFENFVFFSYLEKHLCSGALEWSEEPVYDVHYDKMLRASKKHWWVFAHWYRPSASHLNTLEFQSPNNAVILPLNICQQEASLHQELHPHESVCVLHAESHLCVH